MTITSPNGQKTTISTYNGINSGSETGLYEANYVTKNQGTYTVDINAKAVGIDTDFTTTFDALTSYDYDIIRTAQSKIDPISNPNSFNVIIDIESFTEEDTITITETVPAVFEIVSDADVVTFGDRKILTWTKNLIDNRTSVEYSYSVPLVFPQLYSLGPLEISSDLGTFFEARSWFVANDPPAHEGNLATSPTCNALTSGSTCTTASYTTAATGSNKINVVAITAIKQTGGGAPVIGTVGTTFTGLTGPIVDLQDGGTNSHTQIYYVDGTGTGTVSVPFTGATSDVFIDIITLSGIDQTTPFTDNGSFEQVYTGSGNVAMTYTAQDTNNILVTLAGVASSNTYTLNTANGHLETMNVVSTERGLAGYTTSLGTSLSYGWTHGGSGNPKWAGMIAEFNAAANTQPLSDNLGITDSLTATASKLLTLSDQVTISDSLTTDASLTKTLSDSVTVSDTIATTASQSLSLSDSVTVSDTIATTASLTKTLSDQITVSESLTTDASLTKTLSDSVTIYDTPASLTSSITKTLSDSVTVSESITTDAALTKSLSDSVTVSESITTDAALSKSLSDSVTVSESITTDAALSKSLSDSVTVSESITTSASLSKSLSDSVTVSESITTDGALSKSLSDSVTVSDSLARTASLSKSLSDSVTVSESITTVLILYLQLFFLLCYHLK
jgi:hypothetical protein